MMNSEDELTLRKLHNDVVRALFVDDDFLDMVYSKQLFSDDQIYKIRAKDTPRDKSRELLLILIRRGPKAFSTFLEALEQSGRGNIADALRMKREQVREELKNKQRRTVVVSNGDERDAAEQTSPSQVSDLLATDRRNEPLMLDSQIYMIAPILPGAFCGQVLLINNIRFESHEERDGSDLDAKALTNFFNLARMRVEEYKNLTRRMMETTIRQFLNNEKLHGPPLAAENGEDEASRKVHITMICILTHGEEGAVYGSDDQRLQIDHIINWMTAAQCPLLAGKPKWLFLQACRGSATDLASFTAGRHTTSAVRDGTEPTSSDDTVNDAKCVASPLAVAGEPASAPKRADFHREFEPNSRDSQLLHSVPAQSDILVSYATCSKYVAWRSRTQGSWYVQDFIGTLLEPTGEKRNGPPRWQALDVQTLLTMTNDRVAQRISSSRAVQTCEFVSRLRKALFFLPDARAKWAL